MAPKPGRWTVTGKTIFDRATYACGQCARDAYAAKAGPKQIVPPKWGEGTTCARHVPATPA